MPAPPKVPNIGSQLDRAIAAYLNAANAGWITDGPPALAAQIFPANSSVANLVYPFVKVHSQRSTDATMGNNRFTIQIRIEQSAVTEVADTNPDAARAILDRLVGQVLYPLLKTENGNDLIYTAQALATTGSAQSQANNSDMSAFACQYWFYQGHTRGEPSEPGSSWVEIITFEAVANPIAVNVTQ